MKHLADRENSIHVSVETADRPLFMQGDPELMKQACLNILLNAVQSMPEGGRLRIRTRRQARPNPESGAWMELSIADTGKGMTPDEMSKIFNPFFTTKARGTGLGLSIVHTIVEKHGGYIDVESTPSKGTEFCIHLPLSSRQAGRGSAAEAPAAREREALA